MPGTADADQVELHMPAGVGDRLKYHRLHSGLRHAVADDRAELVLVEAAFHRGHQADGQARRGAVVQGPLLYVPQIVAPDSTMCCLVQAVELQVDVHGVAGTVAGGELVDESPVGGQPDAVGVDDDGLDRAGLGGVDELEELFVDGRFATEEHHHFGFTLGGNERVEHPFTLRRGDGVAVGLVARVGETDRAVQVAVCVDLDQPQAGVLLVVRAQPAVTGTAVAHLGLKPQRKGARFVESC